MRSILNQRHTFVRKVEEDDRCPQNTASPDHMCIQNMTDTDQCKNKHFPADAPEADCTGQLMVINSTHQPGDIVEDCKNDQGNDQPITTAEEPAEPSADYHKYGLYRIPEFFHDMFPSVLN